MQVEVVWSKLARQDLIDHYLTLAIVNSSASDRLYDRIERRVQQLAEHPRIGPRRPDIRISVRMLVEAPFVILYQTSPDSDDGPVKRVTIVRVVHGRRDFRDPRST